MTEFYGPGDPLPHIPDDLTVAQFLLDSHHLTRPVRPHGLPWFIEESSGREIGYDEVCISLSVTYSLQILDPS